MNTTGNVMSPRRPNPTIGGRAQLIESPENPGRFSMAYETVITE
jgi:hypothetical protein